MMPPRPFHHALLALPLLSLAACMNMAPKDVRIDAGIPARLSDAPQPAGDPAMAQPVDYRWVFRDARLQKLIETALANNRDLRIAAANIDLARAQFRIQNAARLPQIDSGATVIRADAGTGRTNANGAPVIGGPRTNLSIDTSVTAFELDLFGRVRSLSEAAQNRYFASEAGARATRLALMGDLATAWITYGADSSLLAISRDTVANAERAVALTKARLEGGIAARTDLRQAETLLSQAQADLARLETAVAQDANLLRLLAGAEVDPALLPASIDDALQGIAEIPAGIDSGVLLRRPDVMQAEYQLAASNAQIGAARAALFPRISLTTVAGLASNVLSMLFTGNAFNYSVAPSIDYPIFRGGAGKANVAQARAQQQAALATYERAIQSAFRETADALARRKTIQEERAAVAGLESAAADALRLVDARYKAGVDAYLPVLDAQRQLYAARRARIATALADGSNLATLFRVLGGDDRLMPAPAENGTETP